MWAMLTAESFELTRPTYSSMSLVRLPAALMLVGPVMIRGMIESSSAWCAGQLIDCGQNLINIKQAARLLRVGIKNGQGNAGAPARAQQFEHGRTVRPKHLPFSPQPGFAAIGLSRFLRQEQRQSFGTQLNLPGSAFRVPARQP